MRTSLHDTIFPAIFDTKLNTKASGLRRSFIRLIRRESEAARLFKDEREDFLSVGAVLLFFIGMLTAIVLEYMGVPLQLFGKVKAPLASRRKHFANADTRAPFSVLTLHSNNLISLPTMAQSLI